MSPTASVSSSSFSNGGIGNQQRAMRTDGMEDDMGNYHEREWVKQSG